MSWMIALLVLGANALLLIVGAYLQSPGRKGRAGEKRVDSALRQWLNPEEYRVFTDLTLPTRGGGTTQIDHMVVSRFGVFIIETKNMSGWIFGSANRRKWTQVIFQFKNQFQNPLHQNFGHLKAVQEILRLRQHQLHNVVAFVGSGVPKTEMPSGVVWGHRSVPLYVETKQFQIIKPDQIDQLVQRLEATALEPTSQTKKLHEMNVRDRIFEKYLDYPRCPLCGATMNERTNRRTDERFLGCSRYPKCRGSRSLR